MGIWPGPPLSYQEAEKAIRHQAQSLGVLALLSPVQRTQTCAHAHMGLMVKCYNCKILYEPRCKR